MGAWRLRTYEALPSTSDLCASLAAAGEPDGLAVLAMRQTASRASRGREWTSPAGNLALSVLLRPVGPAVEAGQWALLAAVALIEALAHHQPAARLSLKWPNDVLRDGNKLSGILVDSAASQDAQGRGRLDWLVIGFGANLGPAPDLPDRRAAGLDAAATPAEVTATLLDRLTHWRRIRTLEGFAPVRHAWLARAHPPGTHLRVRAGAAEIAGQFAGLDDDGALLLQSGGRVRAFSTGEILQAEG